MADHIQRPDKTAGGGAAFIVVDHYMRIRRQADGGEHGRNLLDGGQLSRRRLLARSQFLDVEQDCSRNMHLLIYRCLAQINDEQGCVAKMCIQVFRLKQQGQIHEVASRRMPRL